MDIKKMETELAEAVETDNPSGLDYYGAEVDEKKVEELRERMAEATRDYDDTPDKGSNP